MQYRFTRKKIRRTAIVLLLIWVIQIVQPLSAFALTSGPSQPESAGFQPVGVSDMVDLFTGDFKYNIPLLDVDGYPINLSYQSGSGMDDEASWVGLGWSLNPGAINRQSRGLPDDFAGDVITTDHRTKEKVTIGGRISAKVEIKGKVAGTGGQGSLSFGIFSDSYTGIGAEIGANAGISFSLANSGALTSGLGIGVISNTASGVDVSPYISLSLKEGRESDKQTRAGLSTSLGYNSRSGLKSLTLGASYSYKEYGASSSIGSLSFNTEPVMPRIQVPYTSSYGSFSIDAGPTAFAVFAGGGGTGYKSVRSVAKNLLNNPGYGFLYSERGKNLKNALHDFTREKENPVIPELPNLAVPVHLPDMFSYTSQMGSGQFRLYRGGTGVFADNETTDQAGNLSIGTDLGIGKYFHGGVTLFNQHNQTTTRKWQSGNSYLAKGNFQDEPGVDPARENVFFKLSGETSMENKELSNSLYNDAALAVKLNNKDALSAFRDKSNLFASNLPVSTAIESTKREVRRTGISYLTAIEAKTSALDTQILTYAFNDSASFSVPAGNQPIAATPIVRDAGYRKAHHISEMTVTSDGGQRMVYGIPVYNIKQEEYSFAVGRKHESDSITRGIVELAVSGDTISYKRGIDEYYHKESQPAYASSFLLTSILSPDYVDKTGDGITKDDLGTAIKFNYSRIGSYKWRTPYPMKNKRTAQLNRGLLADPDDDKGSIIYGEKELYYVHSIESKTQIAYFITADREDGLGVTSHLGTKDATTRQRKLVEIRLYSKADTTRPIKTVKFQYDYQLCPETPNSASGKLTLTKVWFEYGNVTKGQYHSYKFTYNTTGADNNPAKYATMSTDRWGTYKLRGSNPDTVSNEEFPYSLQDSAAAAKNASAWQLSSIELPTGGIIDITYESDDYAYVQNRKAAVMQTIEGLTGSAAPNDLDGASGISLVLDSVPPGSVSTPQAILQWFRDTYLNGSDHMYVKSYVRLANGTEALHGKQEWDYVSAYCKLTAVSFAGNTATVSFEPQQDGGVSAMPVYFAAWQKLKNEYPRYAYPGFMNRAKPGDAGKQLKAAVSAIVNAVKNLSELKENFYKKASRKKLARYINPDRTFVRLTQTSGKKLGGGARVKKIRIRDNWQGMTDNSDAPAGSYGQSYDYSRTENGKRISSGVASYEPAIGNDENAMKKPVPYVQKIKGALSNFFELEEPFGESFFPSPSVGYSQVSVRDLDTEGNEQPSPRTGYVVHEFYTAREFPVKVTVLPLQRNMSRPSFKYSLVVTNSLDELVMSQGYSVEVNDMHGKPRAMRVFNQAGAEISSTEYQYNVENPGAEELKLKNAVDVIMPDGNIAANTVLGRNIEFFTDFREQESKNSGQTVNIGFDVIPLGLFPVPIPHWPVNANNEYKLFRSASAVKVVQNYGLLSRVIKNENGSSIATENVAYDGVTGEAILTRTQNEFRQWVYSFNMPAYWTYHSMGGAYKNLGILLKNFSTSPTAVPAYTGNLHAGDELTDISNGNVYWIVENGGGKYVIDREGELVKSLNVSGYCKITRSGYRNILSAPASSLVSLSNPIRNGKLQITSSANLGEALRVISASAMLYDEEWGMSTCQGTEEILTDNSLCYTFCTGGNTLTAGFYGQFGAKLQDEEDENSYTTLSSVFWNDTSCYEPTFMTLQPAGKGGGSGNQMAASVSSLLASSQTDSCTRSDYYPSGSFACRPLNRSGIWPCVTDTLILDEWIGFETCIDIPTSKTYYMGYASDNSMKIYLDGVLLDDLGYHNQAENAFWYWWIKPYYITAGKHTLRVEFINLSNGPGNSNAGNAGAVGLELYDNTYAQIQGADDIEDLNILFTTASLRGVDVQSMRNVDGEGWRYKYTDGTKGLPIDLCGEQPKINPYLHGLLGNWRASQNLVYQVNRKYDNTFAEGQKGIGIKDAGYFNGFYSYWHTPTNNGWSVTGKVEWVAANTVTLYDRYGQELENRDALGRYSSALFDFNGEFPAAVSSNAMNREIYASSFEDNRFRIVAGDTCSTREFVHAVTGQKAYTLASSQLSHSGNYSVLLPTQGIKLSTFAHTSVHKQTAGQYLSYDQGYSLKDVLGLYPRGFAPAPSKKYVFQAWVKDAEPTQKTVNVSLHSRVGFNSPASITLTCKAIVEGWKLLEGTIEVGAINGQKLDIILTALDPDIYVDDIRMFPFDAHMKTYAYNDKTMKLMAELDENAFATFYEYDDEGSLVRVKKETERGVVTLRETRSSYRKKL